VRGIKGNFVSLGDKGVSWTASLSLQGAVGALPECWHP